MNFLRIFYTMLIRSEMIGFGHYLPNKVLTNDDLSKMVETNDEYDKRQCNMISRMKKGDWVVLGRDYKIAALGVIDDEEVSEIDCEPFHWKRKVNWLVTGL